MKYKVIITQLDFEFDTPKETVWHKEESEDAISILESVVHECGFHSSSHWGMEIYMAKVKFVITALKEIKRANKEFTEFHFMSASDIFSEEEIIKSFLSDLEYANDDFGVEVNWTITNDENKFVQIRETFNY